jgi:predicted Fe-Mo cluster-binding NifX family protein
VKIAISATADGWSEKIDDRFGRAQGFFVYDTDNDEASYIDNLTNVDAAHGAGTSAAQTVLDSGAEVVITGNVGPKAGAVLKAGGIRVFACADATSIRDAVERFQNGELAETHV